MLSSIRKFSSSIYAKILLGIVIIPFVFWGMGSSFIGGNKNIVVKINKDKFSTQDFVSFIQSIGVTNRKITSEELDELLSVFIGNKLIEREYEYFGIKLSDISLSKLIKNQKEFKRENKFSRTEYEKFLLTRNLKSIDFETQLSKQEKKRQLLNFIGGGISPSKFIINETYNKINQKRNIELINLNNIFKKEHIFSESEIKSYYESNMESYKEIYKSVKILEIHPNILIASDEYNDLFFKKIDDIYDQIIQGKKMDIILNEYNLGKSKIFTFNKSGLDLNSHLVQVLPKDLIKNIFSLDDSEPTALIESQNKFLLIEVIKTEDIQRDIKNKNVRENIALNLQIIKKRNLLTKIISKINQDTFLKTDFDKLSKDKNVKIKKVVLNNLNDDKTLKNELVEQIYSHPENKIIVIHDLNFIENFLIYIDKVENVSINDSPGEYEKYQKLSKVRISNGLFNTYDKYIKNKYEIDINYNALKTVKNYFD